jgi:uncharacterized protein (DUF885 family)
MKKLLLFIFTASIVSCQNQTAKQETSISSDTTFNKFKEHFIEKLWQQFPGWASGNGFHKYDSVLVVPSAEVRNSDLQFAKSYLDSLTLFKIESLSANNKTDYWMIENQLNSIVWSDEKFKSYEWNPSEYNVCGSFAEILNGNYDSLNMRIHFFYLKMKNIPEYYKAAKINIKNPTKEHTQLAIEQNLGGISVFESDLQEALNKDKTPQHIRTEIEQRAKESVTAIKDYVEFLKNLKSNSPRSFRLGEELYKEKFDLDIQSEYTAQQIFEKALARKFLIHQKMFELTARLWPKYIKKELPKDTLLAIKTLIDKLSEEHCKPEEFQSTIEKQIPELEEFVKQKNLLYIDPKKPLVVRKEPDYMAGVAGASISAPGPYDKNGNTYYNVGSLAGWDKAKAESYLREYNKYVLQILNIHEAIPGHYTQLVYANQSPSLIKSLFGNNAMIEGWAVYTELMMLENGYGAEDKTSNTATDEMWLMYYKWNLRSTCNTILDYSVHAKNMSREQALDLLVNQAFQQNTEAENKWRRVSLTQVQLCSYFTGFSEIVALRDEIKTQQGAQFELKKFNEQFLSYGSSPVKYIKKLMLEKQ